MNMLRPNEYDAFLDPVDRILAEIAFNIQLPPSLHSKAVTRYEAVRNFLEATATFRDGIEHFYPQGSMAIDATISTRGTDDEFDIDIIAQLGLRFRGMQPLEVLKTLERELKDYPVKKVLRQTRCVTLFYADRMHLDISPSFRIHGTPDRRSRIMHAPGPLPSSEDHQVSTDAYGFAEHYKAKTPIEPHVFRDFQRRWQMKDGVRADADVDEVPDQTHFGVKNMSTLALQLTKRFRNIRHDQKGRTGRMAPSVMLANYAARTATTGLTLSEALIRLCTAIIREIDLASSMRKLLVVVNPTFDEDVFTDRWPADITQQNEFANDLRDLVNAIKLIRSEAFDPYRLPEVLRDLFGGFVVNDAIERIAKESGAAIQSASQGYTRRGGVIASAAAVAAPSLVAARSRVEATPHRFFGDPV